MACNDIEFNYWFVGIFTSLYSNFLQLAKRYAKCIFGIDTVFGLVCARDVTMSK